MNEIKILIFTILCILFSYIASVQVVTSIGVIQGNDKGSYHEYLGIPYIEPPVNELRFKPPVPKRPMSQEFNATQFSAGCPQRCELPPRTCPEVLKEDCVTLNIYKPASATPSSRLPVLVFFPGGHFEQGGAGVTLYDGQFLVNQGNFILVTVSYRLGALGWLAHTDFGMKGNLGLMDQREALHFIRKNIIFFGGNENNITISGQSAGAVSVAGHLISKKSSGLFHSAIINSDPLVIPMQNSEYATSIGKRFAEQLKCTTFECIQNAPIDAVLEAQYESTRVLNKSAPLVAFMELTVYVDGEDITQNALDAFREGNFADVPIIIGSTSEEALIFIMQALAKEMSTVEYVAFLTAIFYPRGAIAEVLYQYPPSPVIGDKRPLLATMGTEYIFFCPTRYSITQGLKHRKNPIYAYEFNQTIPGELWGPLYNYCTGKVCHGSDLAYWFQSLRTAGVPVSENESNLMKLMTDYVTNFLYTGNPSKGPKTVQEWPKFDEVNTPYMSFYSEKSEVRKDLHKQKCDFWDSIGKPYPYHFGFDDTITIKKAIIKAIQMNQNK